MSENQVSFKGRNTHIEPQYDCLDEQDDVANVRYRSLRVTHCIEIKVRPSRSAVNQLVETKV
jgi:hypothetical protein